MIKYNLVIIPAVDCSLLQYLSAIIKARIISSHIQLQLCSCQINTECEPLNIDVVPVIGTQIVPKFPQTPCLSQLKT